MTKKIDEIQLIEDFKGGKIYVEIALRHKCSVGAITYRLRKLGLRRVKQNRELFSAEERYIFSKMLETHGGRKQLLEILREK